MPLQTVVEEGLTVIAGGVETFTVLVAVFTQPFASVPVTVYVVVVVGDAVTLVPVEELSVPDGVHV